MPIYEYRCTSCGHQIEVMQKMGERPLRKCSKCAGRLEKLISRAAFQLRGGGWYSEGYAKDGPKKPASAKGDAGETQAKPKSGDSSTDASPRKTAAG
jgi:putative FmdB family regulatory protein